MLVLITRKRVDLQMISDGCMELMNFTGSIGVDGFVDFVVKQPVKCYQIRHVGDGHWFEISL